jgi:signal transduction histidine kinase
VARLRWTNLPFRIKLFLLFVAVSVLPLLAVGVFVTLTLAAGATATADRDLGSHLDRVGLYLAQRGTELETSVAAASRDNLVTINLGLGLDSAVQDFLRTTALRQGLDYAGVVGADGEVVIDGSPAVGLDRVVSALGDGAAGRFVVFLPGATGGTLVLGTRAVLDTRRMVFGVRLAGPEPGRVLTALRDVAGLPVLAVSDGRALAYSNGPVPGALPAIDGTRLVRLNLGGESFLFRFLALPSSPGAHGNYLGIGLTEADFLAERNSVLGGLLVVLGLALGFSALGALLFSRRVTRPIDGILGGIQGLKEGRTDVVVPTESEDEIGTLAREFNEMARRLGEGLAALQAEVAERNRAEREVLALNEGLERLVQERTEALVRSNEELQGTIANLEAARAQLVESEKLAALGQLVASLAHELNTPLAAIASSNVSSSTALGEFLVQLPDFASGLSGAERRVFDRLFSLAVSPPEWEPSGAARAWRHRASGILEAAGVAEAGTVAEVLADLGIRDLDADLVAALAGAHGPELFSMVEQVFTVSRSRRIITVATEKATRTITALKSYVHLDQVGEPVEFNLADEIEAVLTLYYGKLRLGVEVKTDFHPVPRIRGRRDGLSQVWFNLINNALQAMEYRGILGLAVFPASPGWVGFSVTDSGPGIPDAVRNRVFEAFMTTKKPGEGSGLGLSIVRQVVEAHGGSVTFDSVPGKTTFTVLLPTG